MFYREFSCAGVLGFWGVGFPLHFRTFGPGPLRSFCFVWFSCGLLRFAPLQAFLWKMGETDSFFLETDCGGNQQKQNNQRGPSSKAQTKPGETKQNKQTQQIETTSGWSILVRRSSFGKGVFVFGFVRFSRAFPHFWSGTAAVVLFFVGAPVGF